MIKLQSKIKILNDYNIISLETALCRILVKSDMCSSYLKRTSVTNFTSCRVTEDESTGRTDIPFIGTREKCLVDATRVTV